MQDERFFISQESGDQMGGASPYLHGPYTTREEAEKALKEFKLDNTYDDFFILKTLN